MTPEEYIKELSEIQDYITQQHKNHNNTYKESANPYVESINSPIFIYISPWEPLKSEPDHTETYEQYNKALQEYAKATENTYYVNAQQYINHIFETERESIYILDTIHPNATRGVQLYTEAFLRGELTDKQ